MFVCVCVYCVCVCVLSYCSLVQIFATLWTVACQTPQSMGFSRQDPGVGCHSLLQGNLLDPGIEPTFLMSPAGRQAFFFFFYH